MMKFVPNKKYSRTALIFCFHLKKTAVESYRLFGEVYDEHVPSQKTCERWFQRFKIGDFDVADKEHGKPLKKYEDVELQALLDEDDKHKNNFNNLLAEQLRVSQQAVFNCLREMGKILKVGRWVPHELNERQMERQKHVKFCSTDTGESHSCIVSLLGIKSGFFLRIPSAKKSWVDPGAPSTSTARPNRFDRKTMLCV